MAIPDSKQALLAAIEGAYAKLECDLVQVPAALAREPGLDGHVKGERMSVCDLVAYLVGWNELVLKWHAGRAAGAAVDFPETGYGWNDLGRLAHKFYKEGEGRPYDDLCRHLAHARARIVALVESLDEPSLFGQAWYGKYPLGRMIHFNSSAPYANARARLRRWKRAVGLPCAR